MWKVLIAGATALAIASTSLAYAQEGSRGENRQRWQPSADDMRAFGEARLAALKGVITPLGHLRRGVISPGSISALRVTGDPAKGDPRRGGPPTPPPTPLIYWGDLSVTGNGDLPLATQRRVESILTPPGENRHFLPPPPSKFCTPPHRLSTASLSVRIASLFSLCAPCKTRCSSQLAFFLSFVEDR